jgi:hypothetical protein
MRDLGWVARALGFDFKIEFTGIGTSEVASARKAAVFCDYPPGWRNPPLDFQQTQDATSLVRIL